jgi:hypothetical protein
VTANVHWAGEPGRCECSRVIVATIDETLTCPYGWRWVPGTGWVHSWPLRRRTPGGRQLAEVAR